MGSYLPPSPSRTAAADFPELCVEWLPNQGPFAGSGEWCDITDYVAAGSTSRGRQYELNQFQAGQCSLTLRAASRLFDPENTAGPFYPWLVPMRQVRVSASWPGAVIGDTFTRADSAVSLGNTDTTRTLAWEVLSGTWGITSNRAYLAVGSGQQFAAVVESGLSDCDVQADLSVNVTDAGLAWRATDASNFWLCNNYTEVGVYKVVAGTPVKAFTYAGVLAEGDTVKVSLRGATGTLYVNGVNVGSWSDSFNQYATKHGLRAYEAANNPRFDNFAITAPIRYPIFRGFITDWGQTVPQDAMYETTISAKDAFALFEQVELASSGFAATLAAQSPTAWFRLNETGTSRVTDSTDNGNYGIFENCEQGVTGLVPGDGDGAVAFAHSLEERITIQTALATAFPFTVQALIKVDPSDPGAYKSVFIGSDNGVGRIRGAVSSTYPGFVEALIADGSATRQVLSTIRVDDDKPHHVVWVFTSGSSFSIYIDGVDCTGTVLTSGTPTFPTIQKWTIGNYPDIDAGDYGFGANYNADPTQVHRGTIDEFAVWQSALDSTTIAALAAASIGWTGDDTGTRVGRILNLIAWPSGRRSISTGISVLGPSTWSEGTSLLSVLQALADTEFGAFFIGRDGTVTWRSRHYLYLTTAAKTSQATFGDGHSSATLKYVADGFDLTRDETLIRNPVLASRSGGVTATAKDAAYQEKYGTRTWSAPTSQDRDDAAMQDRAAWLVARYKELSTRLAGMRIVPRRDPANLWPKALGLEIGDRITVKRTPLGLNNEVSVDQIIESVSHSFGPRQWSTTYQGSPVDTNTNTFLILDDATYGLLDSFRLAY